MKLQVKRAISLIFNLLYYSVLLLCLAAIVLVIVTKRDGDGAANILGYQMRIVQSASMEKHEDTDTSALAIKDIRTKSCIFIQTMPQDEARQAEWLSALKVGDVLTFKYVYIKQETITHRIVAIEEKEGGYLITLQGDNKASDSETLTQVIDTSVSDSPNYIIGKVVGKSYLLGLVIYLFKTPLGMIFIVIVPCLVIIVIQIVRIVDVCYREKRQRQEQELLRQREEYDRKARELEELKRQLEAQAKQPLQQ